MKEYFLTIITTTFFLAMLDGILPKNKNGKLVKSIISVVSVTIILVPILNFLNSDYKTNFNDNLFNDYEKYLTEYHKKTTESEIETLLKSNGYDVTSVHLTKIDDKNFIEIFLNDTGINDDSEHINRIENAKNRPKFIKKS